MIRSAPASRQPMTAPRPTSPHPNTTHVEPGWTSRRVQRGADARREAARERRAPLERRLGRDLRERDLRHHRVLGERRRAHEVPHRLAASREPRRPVRQVALPLHVADCNAAVRASAAAVDALAALGREERDDVVARRDERDARPDALDDAGALVPEHARRVPGRVGARGGVEIGVTHAARGKPHEHLARPSALRGRAPGRRAAARTPRALRRGSSRAEANPKRAVGGSRSRPCASMTRA